MHNAERHLLLILGQLGGYSSGLLSYLGEVKDVFGFIGVACGTTLSVWALVDRIRTARKKSAESTPPFAK